MLMYSKHQIAVKKYYEHTGFCREWHKLIYLKPMKLFISLPFSTVHSLPPLSSAIAKSICILKHRHLSSGTQSQRGDGCAVLALSVQTIVAQVFLATAVFYSISNSFLA